jgi:hypothetical protein
VIASKFIKEERTKGNSNFISTVMTKNECTPLRSSPGRENNEDFELEEVKEEEEEDGNIKRSWKPDFKGEYDLEDE